MLLELQDTDISKIESLLEWANEQGLHLSLLDTSDSKNYLPGKSLTDLQLKDLIENSRNSGLISLDDAHHLIRKNVGN